MINFKHKLIRDVKKEECPWLDRDFSEGEVVFLYNGHTYGCISFKGLPFSEVYDQTPFFELPKDAVKQIK